MHKFSIILIFTVLFYTAAKAQHKNNTDTNTGEVSIAEEKTDESNDGFIIDTTLFYNKPVFDQDSIKAWKTLKDFAYVNNLDSLLKEQKDVKQKHEEQPEERTNWLGMLLSNKGVQYFLWALAIGFVLYILFKLFLTEGVFRKKSKSIKATPEVEEEIITSETDLDSLIRQALQSGNYRLAIRYQYLKTLHKLADKKIVELAADKTNYNYVREIGNLHYQNDFASLTLNYEYVWYGNFEIEENIYNRLEPAFSQFNNRL